MTCPQTGKHILPAFLGFILLTVSAVIYKGPYHEVCRSHLGDLFGVAFVYFGWRWILRRQARWWIALALASAMAYGVELYQLLCPPPTHPVARFLLGTTFSWTDVWMYTIGLGIAVAWDRIQAPE